jgi:hypothetical protein
MPVGERCRRAVCGRTARTVRCGGGRQPRTSRPRPRSPRTPPADPTTREFVANGGGRSCSAPPQCCVAGADGQPWPCWWAWLVAFRGSSLRRLFRRSRDPGERVSRTGSGSVPCWVGSALLLAGRGGGIAESRRLLVLFESRSGHARSRGQSAAKRTEEITDALLAGGAMFAAPRCCVRRRGP